MQLVLRYLHCKNIFFSKYRDSSGIFQSGGWQNELKQFDATL